MTFRDKISSELRELTSQSLLRKEISQEGIDFISNDYLGIAKNTIEINSSLGSGGSRLLGGSSEGILELESDLAKKLNYESALILPSGYQTNVALWSTLPDRNTAVFYDEECHASFRDGLRLSNARGYSFLHNSVEDLKYKFQNFKREYNLISIESLYSMTGRFALIEELSRFAKNNNALLICDSAHSAGIYKNVVAPDIEVITFSKAYGTDGGVILSDKLIREYLINKSRGFIYSTGIGEYSIEAKRTAIGYINTAKNSTEMLFENSKFFQSLIEELEIPFLNDRNSHKKIIKIASNKDALLIGEELLSKGFQVGVVRPPTVKDAILRINVHSFNTKEEIKGLVQELKSLF